MNGLLLAVVSGACVAGGLWALSSLLVPVHPRLGDALHLLDGRLSAESDHAQGVDRLGSWVRRRFQLIPDEATHRQLQLRGLSVNRLFSYKALAALVGLLLPSLLGAVLLLTSGISLLLPVGFGLLCGLIGFFGPDLWLSRGATTVTSDATESLLTFVDLVTLERLANRSATQALHAAAGVSDATVFVAIRGALERARLEQRAPFAELRQLGRDLDLPALCDVADVMRLDDSGAALSGALRARVKELRDAHLTQAKIAAAGVSERMTVFMVLPSLIFGLIFLVPPLMRLVSSG